MRSLLLTHRNDTILHWCLPIYGVFRSATLRETDLIGRFNKSDTVTLVQCALRGAFLEVPEVLFFNRKHAESSQANRTKAEIAAWFDPSTRTAVTPMVKTRLYIEFVRSVLTAPLAARDRLACLSVVMRRLGFEREWRFVGGEMKLRARELVHRRKSAEEDPVPVGESRSETGPGALR